MSIVLLAAPTGYDLAPLARACSPYGVECSSLVLDPALRSLPSETIDPERAVLVAPEAGVIRIGERLSLLRRLLGDRVPIVLCTYRLSVSDRETLKNSGATSVVTPRSWTDPAVSERILAELILDGTVQPSSYGPFRGGTLAMRRIYDDIERVAPFGEPILILGETGTGKELVAHCIHQSSGRKGEIAAINVSALKKDLIESELFGHERGAFTGAERKRDGLLVDAGAGTVFLDEIGDLEIGSQVKLLRVLEEGKVRLVGGNHLEDVKARFVLATHRDLAADCASGRFRRDLYERIRGFALSLPPLRERRADIPLLVKHFVAEFDRTYGGEHSVPSGALDVLFRYDWPGNIRELRSVVFQAAMYARATEGPISSARLQEVVLSRQQESVERTEDGDHVVRIEPAKDCWQDVVDRAQAVYFPAVVAHFKGNKTAAADHAGFGRSQFYSILKRIAKGQHGN